MENKRSIAKKITGVFFVIVGLLALVTPFTPGSWLIFVGLEFLGLRMLFWKKMKARFQKWKTLKAKDEVK